MSDFSISLVPNKTEVDNKEIVRNSILDYLINRKIIRDEKSDCVLNSKGGFPPGKNVSSILIDENDNNFKSLWTNGLEIIEERTVFHTGGNGIEKIKCPKCDSDIIDSDWGNYIDYWYKGKDNSFECPDCKKRISITNCNFEPNWGFSDFGLTFWNWPNIKESLVRELEEISNLKFKKVYTHI